MTGNKPERTNVGSYNMKAQVVAEKLKGRKDLEVISWASTHLNFHIQYRRNIYRWKKNPIILRLAKEYAGLIENAEVPDRIRNSYRVLNSKSENLHQWINDYVSIAMQYEIPIEENFVALKLKQLCEHVGMSREEIATVSATEISKLRRNHPSIDQNRRALDLVNAQSMSRQKHINTIEEWHQFVRSNSVRNSFWVKESIVRYELVDEVKLARLGLLDLVDDILEPVDEEETFVDDESLLPVSPLFPQMMMTIFGASLDGSIKLDPFFVGSVTNPMKQSVLSAQSCYFPVKTGWVSQSLFLAFLFSLSTRVSRSNPSARALVVCTDSRLHKFADYQIPGNIQMVLVKPHLLPFLDSGNILDATMVDSFENRVFTHCLSSLEAWNYLKDFSGSSKSTTEKSLHTVLLRSLVPPITDCINLLTGLWHSLSPDIVCAELPMRSPTRIRLDHEIGRLQKSTDSMKASINKYLKTSSVFRSIEVITKSGPKFVSPGCLDMSFLQGCSFEEDLIFKQIFKKPELESSVPMLERVESPSVASSTSPTEKSKHVSISSMLNSHASYEPPISEGKFPVLDSSSTVQSSKAEFKKAVYNLYLQFVLRPGGPFKHEIFKEMTFEQIYKLTKDSD